MTAFPREEAAAIYRRLYWLRPRFDQVARRSPAVAAELFDTGANMGPAVASTFLQRALTALNRNGKDYPDLVPDGRIGPATLAALDAFLKLRGSSRPLGSGVGDQHQTSGETVLLRALEALQGERYLASPSAARPTRRSSTAGSRTVSVSLSSRQRCRCP